MYYYNVKIINYFITSYYKDDMDNGVANYVVFKKDDKRCSS